MFKSLLIAIDGSDLSSKALAKGLELAKGQGARVVVLTTTDPVSTGLGAGFGSIDAGPIVERLEAAYAEEAGQLLAGARAKAEAAGVAVETLHLPRHRPADGILETAGDRGTDLIVMGSHGRRGLNRLLLGSQAAEVLARSTLPVLIMK